MQALGTLAALAGMATFIITAVVLGHWLLGPVNRAAGHLNAPTRFMLTDFIWLMIQLQLVLGLVLQAIRETLPLNAQLLILALLCLPVLVLWVASVSVVSRAGITQPLRRATLILVLVPGALAEIMAVPLVVVAGIVFATQSRPEFFPSAINDGPAARVAILVAAAMALILWAGLLRWLSFWVLDFPSPATPSVPAAAGGGPHKTAPPPWPKD